MEDFKIEIEVKKKDKQSVQLRCELKGNGENIINGLCEIFNNNSDIHGLFSVALLGSKFPLPSDILARVCDGRELISIESEADNMHVSLKASTAARIAILSIAIKQSESLQKLVLQTMRRFNEKFVHKKQPFDHHVEEMDKLINQYKQDNIKTNE